MGTVEVAAPGAIDDEAAVPPGAALDEDDVVSVGAVDAGGVLEVVAAVDVDGGVLGAIDDVDDVESVLEVVEGVVDDDEDDEPDGEGVTIGGVVVVAGGVDDSRLQPATPIARPVQSSVTKAVFIAISQGG